MSSLGTSGAPSLLLLRHGQSEWNAVRRWQGVADTPLTELGRRQADEAARALSVAEMSFSAVWASDLRRASETAAIIAAALGTGGVQVDPRLREADAGPWEGLTPTQIERRWPGWLAHHRRPEGFEPAESVVARAMAACADLLDHATDRPVLAVTHSGLIRALRRHLGVVDERVPNLTGSWFGRDSDGQLRAIGGFGAPSSARGRSVPDDDAGEGPGDETRPIATGR